MKFNAAISQSPKPKSQNILRTHLFKEATWRIRGLQVGDARLPIILDKRGGNWFLYKMHTDGMWQSG